MFFFFFFFLFLMAWIYQHTGFNNPTNVWDKVVVADRLLSRLHPTLPAKKAIEEALFPKHVIIVYLPAFMACVNARRLLNGLRLRSLRGWLAGLSGSCLDRLL